MKRDSVSLNKSVKSAHTILSKEHWLVTNEKSLLAITPYPSSLARVPEEDKFDKFSEEAILKQLIIKQQHLTLVELKNKKRDAEKQRKYLQSLIQRNRELKSRAFTVREFEHLIKRNQAIKEKIDDVKNKA